MKLSNNDEATIVVAIAELLGGARITPSGRVAIPGAREAIESTASKIGKDLHEKIVEACGDLGLYDFVLHTINRQILGSGIKGRQSLVDVAGYEDNLQTAKTLLEKLRDTPQKLQIISPLPISYSGVLFNGIEDINLGDGISVVSADKVSSMLDPNFTSERIKSVILRSVDLDKFPASGTHFLCTWHSTFVGGFASNPALQEHQDKLRSLHGCLLSLGVVEEDFFFDRYEQYAILGLESINPDINKIVLADGVDSDLNQYYENFDISLNYYKEYEGGSVEGEGDVSEPGPLSWSWGELDDDEKRLQKNAIEDLKKISKKDDHSRKLVTSSLWLFRSFVSSKSLDVILESTIALEVLLGDRNEASGVGLTKLLANRCAYLLGDSDESRRALMEDFKSIYEIRSGIVHSGLHQTGRKASKASEMARDLASRVLRKELDIASE